MGGEVVHISPKGREVGGLVLRAECSGCKPCRLMDIASSGTPVGDPAAAGALAAIIERFDAGPDAAAADDASMARDE